MGMFDMLGVSGSGLSATRLQMDVTSSNLANAETPGYRRKEVVLQSAFDQQLGQAMGVRTTAIVEDKTPNRLVYDPTDPSADAKGYVSKPNVSSVQEMTDLIAASRAYEANVTAMQTAKQMFTKTLDILR